MKFSAKLPVFLEAASKAKRAVGSKDLNEIMRSMLVDAREDGTVVLAGTNTSETVVVEIEADVHTPGASALMGDDLYALISRFPKGESRDINFELDHKGWCNIQCGKIKSRVAGLDPEMYPKIHDGYESDAKFKVTCETITRLFGKTIFCIDKKDTRVQLTGVYFQLDEENERILATTTDGHRLALCYAEHEFLFDVTPEAREWIKEGVIIPGNVVQDMLSFISGYDPETVINFSRFRTSGITLQHDKWRMTSMLIDAKYPNLLDVLPKEWKRKLQFDRGQFLEAVRLVSLFAEDKSNKCRLHISGSKVLLEATDKGRGEVEQELDIMEGEHTGDEVVMGYQVHYLKDALSNVDGASIELRYIDNTMPSLIQDTDDLMLQMIVMPMRV